MVYKPIAIMILPIFVAGILMLSILLAATANAADDNNTGSGETQAPPPAGGGGGGGETAAAAPPPATETPPPAEAPPAGAPQGATNNETAADLTKSILDVHNSERAAVGVPPLVWSDSLAAGAKTWAEHLATTPEFAHDPDRGNVGENLAGFNPSKGVSAPGEGQMLWVAEKKDWHGGVLTQENWYPTGHYTQMVWKDTKEVGCATASGGGHWFSILVCRYSPGGNVIGQAPY
jgi:uncharacterized protein YkwD